METRRFVRALAGGVLGTVLVLATGTAYANDDRRDDRSSCLPGIADAFHDSPVYARLFDLLDPHTARLRALLDAVDDQASYQMLLTRANRIASSIRNGRVLVTLPDGTVVLDTAVDDDPSNTLPSGNSFRHFQQKTVNENHNSRVAIMSAQLFPCGVGLERKLSTTTSSTQTYFAIRLGKHLDNSGTVRLSITQ